MKNLLYIKYNSNIQRFLLTKNVTIQYRFFLEALEVYCKLSSILFIPKHKTIISLQHFIGRTCFLTEIIVPIVKGNVVTLYVVHIITNAELQNNIIDKQGLKNNSIIGKNKIKHDENHVQKYQENSECGTPGKRVATANFSHGTPNTIPGKVVQASPTDYKGNNQTQNAVMYYNPPKTSVTPEIPELTAFINKPEVKQNTDRYENIP